VAGQERGDGIQKSRASKVMRAAEYVRMSTDHQRYSTENQSFVPTRIMARAA
jgi:hypothetical protein